MTDSKTFWKIFNISFQKSGKLSTRLHLSTKMKTYCIMAKWAVSSKIQKKILEWMKTHIVDNSHDIADPVNKQLIN